jgi:predicted P-loop ATPase
LAIQANSRHPIREYLYGLKWDGVARLETLFIEYLCAEDSRYIREATKKALVGAVARAMEPGCKHDHVLVLVGPQGCGKSTALSKLGKQWFSDSLYTMNGKEAYELLQGSWIVEMGEMAATKRAELEQIKQFISKRADNYRSAYARRAEEHPRQCAFFGSTNDNEFMRDSTGGRRFWPVPVAVTGKGRIADMTDEIIDGVWAEALALYQAGEPWYFDDAELAEDAAAVQAAHTEVDSRVELIVKFLEQPMPRDWNTMPLDARLAYLYDEYGGQLRGETRRDRIAAIEVWVELFRKDPADFTQAVSRSVTALLAQLPNLKRGGKLHPQSPYGRPRAFSVAIPWEAPTSL